MRTAAKALVSMAMVSTLLLSGCASQGNDQGAAASTDSAASSSGTTQQASSSGDIAIVTADDVANLPDDAVLVDTRTAEEYAEGHIPGALNVSYPKSTGGPCQADDNKASFVIEWEKLAIPTDAHVVLYCRTGVRAKAAADALAEMGYTDVSLYQGSWQDWTSDSSRPIEGD